MIVHDSKHAVQSLKDRILISDDVEQCIAVMLDMSSESIDVRVNSFIFLNGNYEVAISKNGIRIPAKVLIALIKTCQLLGAGLAIIHTHPNEDVAVSFSGKDMAFFRGLCKCFEQLYPDGLFVFGVINSKSQRYVVNKKDMLPIEWMEENVCQ